ncbi:EamA family transporter [Clostridiaceae bacterium 14S0207]|nr:EamA family transporter [Clostridiaceae bacterium 14S0207]
MKCKSRKFWANLCLFICAIIWGGGFPATDIALRGGLRPFYGMGFRFSIAFVLLSIVFYKKLKNINKQDIKGGLVVGFVVFLAFAVQTIGLQYTTPGKQAFLTGLYVVIVPFLYWMLTKHAPDKYQFIGTALCLIGTCLLTLNKGFCITKGDTLSILGAVFFALNIVVAEYYNKKSDPVVITIIQMGVSAVCSFLAAIICKETSPAFATLHGWLGVIYLGIFSTMIAYIIQNVALKYTSSTEAAIILSLETVFGSLFSAILLGEQFTLKMIVGCLIIFIALITAETKWSFLKKSEKDQKNTDKMNLNEESKEEEVKNQSINNEF